MFCSNACMHANKKQQFVHSCRQQKATVCSLMPLGSDVLQVEQNTTTRWRWNRIARRFIDPSSSNASSLAFSPLPGPLPSISLSLEEWSYRYIYTYNIQIRLLINIVIKSLLDCYWIAWIANHLLSPIVPYWYRLVLSDPSQMNQAGPAQDPSNRIRPM